MIEIIRDILQQIGQKHADQRLHVFSIEIGALEGLRLSLAGRVLEQADLQELVAALSAQIPGLRVDGSGVRVLRQPQNPFLSVGTNLTSLHAFTSFLSEMSSQMVFGQKVEQLDESGAWIFSRQMDGYLAWTYKPYLTASLPPVATHILLAPALELRSEPDAQAPILTRLFCGTCLKVESTENNWAQVTANETGWLPLNDLRTLDAQPRTVEARRQQMILDARRMIGVPYLWGGTTGNGIDCSAFARLLHAWVGLEIPRDADMQCSAARPVEPPFAPGDLLFFGENDSDRRITHVGVSLGGWEMIHSSRSRNGVNIDNVQKKEGLRSIFVCAGTFIR